MTDTHPAPAAEPAAPPAPVDLLAEPTFEEIIEEGNRYFDERKAGKFNDVDIPGGHHFAYFGGRIHGHDPDMIALQHRVASALNIHWARVIIDCCEDWGSETGHAGT